MSRMVRADIDVSDLEGGGGIETVLNPPKIEDNKVINKWMKKQYNRTRKLGEKQFQGKLDKNGFYLAKIVEYGRG